ncbi:sensor histidine kinase [Aurantiacibacter sp. MUD61]|uniref:sensor histidine kinase n=1 Tax=Aurantiacibacter sp. MUD61 TaxID=3009083 RepID=UPI0022F0B0D6|nr:ATP-binding protein [Aurantiacibacter sp. MUD61]
MLRRMFPQSLLGQVMLAVAGALLLAQMASAVLLFRAGEQRREAAALTGAAFQLVNGARSEAGERPVRRAREGRRARDRGQSGLPPALRYQRTETPPAGLAVNTSEGDREAFLRELLARQGADPNAVRVAVVRAGEDPTLNAFAAERPRFNRLDDWRSRRLLIAAVQLDDGGDWQTARILEPPRQQGAVAAIIFQTLVIFVIVMTILYLMLRRITRPLGALASRVEDFDGSRSKGEPLPPSGPADTRRLITAHNAMEARIAALLDEKDVMLGAIGHDLKTPLAALRVRIESVENDTERARMAASIEDITTSLDDILSLARVGRPSDPLERTDLAALIGGVVEEYEDRGRDVVLSESKRIAIPLRATWLRRALRNLISNALRYGDQARVSLAREDGAAVIRIADNGPGIPDNQIAEMLEPFTRGEASRNRETGGAGLGLTLARAIAEQHGGTLTLANDRGADGEVEGLVAEIRLPMDGSA